MTTKSKSMKLAGVKVGDEIVAYTPGFTEDILSPWVVTGVGKKFITAKNDFGSVARFCVENGRKDGSYSVLTAMRARPVTADDYLAIRSVRAIRCIQNFANRDAFLKELPLDQLERIATLIDEFRKPKE